MLTKIVYHTTRFHLLFPFCPPLLFLCHIITDTMYFILWIFLSKYSKLLQQFWTISRTTAVTKMMLMMAFACFEVIDLYNNQPPKYFLLHKFLR